ncbi:hypothetical protein HH299_14405, partial [Xanthomonas sp. Kuri4-2]
MIDKNFRLNPLAGAILLMALGVSAAQAAPPLLAQEPTRSAPADAASSSRLIVQYKAGTPGRRRPHHQAVHRAVGGDPLRRGRQQRP